MYKNSFVEPDNFQSAFVYLLSGSMHDPELSCLKQRICECGCKERISLTKQKFAKLTKGTTLIHQIYGLLFVIQIKITGVDQRIICGPIIKKNANIFTILQLLQIYF